MKTSGRCLRDSSVVSARRLSRALSLIETVDRNLCELDSRFRNRDENAKAAFYVFAWEADEQLKAATKLLSKS